jgi:uncharacterized protein involved in exopolysaccharide biosynthesis
MSEQVPLSDEDRDDVPPLWPVLWDHKYLILIVAIVGGAVAAFIAYSMTPLYRAEVAVTEVHQEGLGGGAASLANQFGGLASIAGINLGAGNGVEHENQAILSSRHLIEEFVKRYDLIPQLLAGSNRTPTLWRAVERFRNNVLAIRTDTRKDTTTVAVEWKNADTAALWANEFVALANEFICDRALSDARRNIAYLNDQIAHTSSVEIQKIMYSLIENETKTLMLANARTEYAFKVVDPAVTPEVRSSPRRLLIMLIGLTSGGLVGALIAITRNSVARRRGGAARNS